MSVAFSEEQRALQATAERFAREKLAPAYQAREQEAAIDRALVREMGALGLIAGDLPEQYGGLGLPSETSGLIIEALAYGDVNVAYVQLLGSLCGQIIAVTPPKSLLRNGCRALSPAKTSSHLPSLSRAGDPTPPISPCRHDRLTRATCSMARNPRLALPIKPTLSWYSRVPVAPKMLRAASVLSLCP